MHPVSSSCRLSRRTLLAAAAFPLLGGAAPVADISAPAAAPPPPPRPDDLVGPGWRREVLIRWGDRVEFDAPPFAPRALTDIAAATQFGWDAVVLGAAPQPPAADGVPRVVLGVGHPDVSERMAFPDGQDRPKLAGLMQGASLLNLEWRVPSGAGGRWVVADGGFQSRRLTSHTPCRFSGPMAALLGQGGAGQTVQGVLGINAGAATPWGTMLFAEGDPDPWFNRLAGSDDAYADRGAEALYGWLVELDPLDPQSRPVKRSAAGRFVRGGLACGLAADGRAVVFMTDARLAGMLLRFVSAAPATVLPGAGMSDVLDGGTLSVACADATGGLHFVDLPDDSATRIAPLAAAAAAGGQVFDGPSGLALAPDGALVMACWGNPGRAAPDAFNPRAHNAAGHVLRLTPRGEDRAGPDLAGPDQTGPDQTGPDQVGTDLAGAEWRAEMVLLAGDPAVNDGIYPEDSETWLSHPTAVATDAAGALWIATGEAGRQTGLYRAAPGTRALTAPYLAPRGAAMGGVVAAGKTIFSAVRHPGADGGASFLHPTTRWPTLEPDSPPRTTLVSLAAR